MDGHVVERGLGFADVLIGDDSGIEHRAPVRVELAGQDAVERRFDVLGRDVDQKAQPPEIDAEQGHVVRRHDARGMEQSAVAADHDDQVADCAEPIQRQRLADRGAEQMGALGLQPHLDGARAQMFAQAHEGSANPLGVALLGDEAERLESGHRVQPRLWVDVRCPGGRRRGF